MNITRDKRSPRSAEEQKTQDTELDENLADSFPASDPPSITQPHKIPARGARTASHDRPRARSSRRTAANERR